MSSIHFEQTEDKKIARVRGLSTDKALVEALGAAKDQWPRGVSYFAFDDKVAAVIKRPNTWKGEGEYMIRDMRGPNASTVPPSLEDPIAIVRAKQAELEKARDLARTQLTEHRERLLARKAELLAEIDQQVAAVDTQLAEFAAA